jgi:hypothetical protein
MNLWSYSIGDQRICISTGSKNIVCPFSFDQRDGIRYDLQNIEVGSEYLSLDMREAPMPFASGWCHYL